MSESNVVRIEVVMRMDFVVLSQMNPAQSRAILDGIAAVVATGKDAADTLVAERGWDRRLDA